MYGSSTKIKCQNWSPRSLKNHLRILTKSVFNGLASKLKQSLQSTLEAIEEKKDVVAALPPPKINYNQPGGRRKSSLMRNFVTTLGSESIRNLLDEDIFNKVASLEAGKSFGEIALIKSKPRQARIICEEN